MSSDYICMTQSATDNDILVMGSRYRDLESAVEYATHLPSCCVKEIRHNGQTVWRLFEGCV